MLTVADRGEGGVKFAKILLTSYVNAPKHREYLTLLDFQFLSIINSVCNFAWFSDPYVINLKTPSLFVTFVFRDHYLKNHVRTSHLIHWIHIYNYGFSNLELTEGSINYYFISWQMASRLRRMGFSRQGIWKVILASFNVQHKISKVQKPK